MPNQPYILTRRSLNPSARILARELGLQKSYEPRNYPPTIRWGNSEGHWENASDNSINRAEIIYIVSSKLRFSTAMSLLRIAHVELLSGAPERFPVVIRNSLTGRGGNGIEIYNPDNTAQNSGIKSWRGDEFWTYWRSFSSEFGVHFFNGKILRIFKKIPREEMTEEEFPIKNMDRGYKFSLMSNDKLPKLHELVEQFCEKFGMTFGRLDVGWNPAIRGYEIIEANSAPGIAENQNTVQVYVDSFKKYLNL